MANIPLGALASRVRACDRLVSNRRRRIDFIDNQITLLKEEIEKQNASYREAVSLLVEIRF